MNNAIEGSGLTRRTALGSAAIGLFTFSIGGSEVLLSPGEARTKGADFQVLTNEEASLLEAFGDALVPGARAMGISHYVDANLVRTTGESMLSLRYFDVLPPHDAFYKDGLKALDGAARSMIGKPFASATMAEVRPLIAAMLPGMLADWQGPPSPLFYLSVRSDAADLVYGTVAAFERMQVPYMPHIEPRSAW